MSSMLLLLGSLHRLRQNPPTVSKSVNLSYEELKIGLIKLLTLNILENSNIERARVANPLKL